jgi:hypothetical protein
MVALKSIGISYKNDVAWDVGTKKGINETLGAINKTKIVTKGHRFRGSISTRTSPIFVRVRQNDRKNTKSKQK